MLRRGRSGTASPGFVGRPQNRGGAGLGLPRRWTRHRKVIPVSTPAGVENKLLIDQDRSAAVAAVGSRDQFVAVTPDDLRVAKCKEVWLRTIAAIAERRDGLLRQRAVGAVRHQVG